MKHLHAVRLPQWSLSWHGYDSASYYGYRCAAIVGPWLVLIWLRPNGGLGDDREATP